MSTNPDINAQPNSATRQVRVNLHSLWIGLAALGCAFLVQAVQLDYTYPLEVMLKGVVNDATVIDDHLYKIKL